MKKMRKLTSLLLALVMVFIACLAGSAAAAGEKIQASKAGVAVNDVIKVKLGESCTTSDGQRVPVVVTYTDAAGKATNYLPTSLLSDLLDLQITWSDKQNSVMLGNTMENVELETHVYPGGKIPANPSSPVMGTTHGPFTEVNPSAVDRMESPVGIDEDKTRVQPVTGFTTVGCYLASDGKYVVVEITNNGKTSVTSVVGRTRTLGGSERFTSVDVAPGKTLTRAFSIAENAEEQKSILSCSVRGAKVTDAIDVTVSLKQYK